MSSVLFDTSVYITALRLGVSSILAMRRLAAGYSVWLSAVVLEELYAGAGEEAREHVGKLEYDFAKAGRVLVPDFGDWVETGRILARMGSLYGYEQVGRARLTNDAVIAASAGRRGFTILTANQRDFARLAKIRPFRWAVVDLSGEHDRG